MERSLRQLAAARSLYKRCYSRSFEEGGQLALAYEWIKFEREEGRSVQTHQTSSTTPSLSAVDCLQGLADTCK